MKHVLYENKIYKLIEIAYGTTAFITRNDYTSVFQLKNAPDPVPWDEESNTATCPHCGEVTHISSPPTSKESWTEFPQLCNECNVEFLLC